MRPEGTGLGAAVRGASRRVAAGLALAALGAGAPVVRAAEGGAALELKGDLFARGEPRRQAWFRLSPRLTVPLSERIVFTLRAVLEADTHGDVDRGSLYDERDRDLRRALLRFEELAFRFDLGAVDLVAGRQRIAWGRADGVNATDNLMPRDWTDPPREERLSPWALRAQLERGRWEAELAVAPRFTPSRLPAPDGRWSSAPEASVPNPAFPFEGPPRLRVEVSDGGSEYPATTAGNAQWGARGGYRGSRAEWSLSWFRGHDDAPRPVAEAGRPRPRRGILPVEITSRHPRLEVLGGDGVLLAGTVALRAEAAYFHYPGGALDGFLLYTTELDWSRRTFRLVVGWADTVARRPGEDRLRPVDPRLEALLGSEALPVGATALDTEFLPAALLRAGRFSATEWELEAQAAVGARRGDAFVRLAGSFPATDRLRLGFEAEAFSGERDTFFGRWRDNDRLRLFTRYVF